ncbi:MAG: protease inhibitor I42 family protein [Dehalococcoidia bacterium]|nr:protease inhibitor I42 family protein [Dehalococcoidia bacterium]
MKLRMIPVFAMLILSLWLTACAPSAGTSVNVTCDDFNTQPSASKQVAVATGNTFTVTLCSNATTGFKWSEAAQISDQTVVQQTGHEFIAPQGTGMVGAPGSEVWTFKALKKGTSTINMEYSRPWEGGEKGTWAFNLTVTVN